MSVTPGVSYPVSGGPGYGVTGLPRYLGGGFFPTDLDGLQLWLRADSISGSDGDSVSTWSDESGNGNDATQGTASDQPTFKTGVQNGLPVVRFDGTDDRMTSDSIVQYSQPTTIFVVGQSDNGASEQGIFIDGRTNGVRHLMRAGTDDKWELYGGSVIGTATNSRDSNIHVFAGVVDGANSILRVDTSEVASGDAGSNSMDAYALGEDKGVAGIQVLDGDIAEVLFYNRRLSSSEIEQVESYLNQKYSIF